MKLSIYILANFFSRLWVAGIGIVLVPQYIKFLGIESYGLVGFYGTLMGSMSILDLGLSTTLNRELTKARVNNTDAGDVRNLVFTLETIYFLIGLAIAAAVILLAPVIATHWIKAEHLSVSEVSNAVMLMGLVVAFQWPISLYNGGLIGMDKQLTDNTIMVVMTTVRSAGVILLLWLVSPTVQTFFIWQAVISFLYVIAMRTGLWRYLPKSVSKPKFSKNQLNQIWRFAAGMTSVGLVTFFLMQADKIILSKILPLTQYAYYVLAFTVSGCINMFVSPINIAFFPKLTALVAAHDNEGLIQTYHKGCRLVASVVFPIGMIMIFFASDILFVWTRNPGIVANTTTMVQILVAGSMINSLLVIPYLFLLANGQTRFTFIQNLIATVLLVPMMFWWVSLYGAVGGTLVWLTVNTGALLISIPLIHKMFLKGQLKVWYIKDTILPLLPGLVSVVVIKWVTSNLLHLKLNLIGLIVTASVVCVATLLFMPDAKVLKNKLRIGFNF